MWAIILLTPILLSIPIGAFLLRKYYSDRRYIVMVSLLVLALEGLICIIDFLAATKFRASKFGAESVNTSVFCFKVFVSYSVINRPL